MEKYSQVVVSLLSFLSGKSQMEPNRSGKGVPLSLSQGTFISIWVEPYPQRAGRRVFLSVPGSVHP